MNPWIERARQRRSLKASQAVFFLLYIDNDPNPVPIDTIAWNPGNRLNLVTTDSTLISLFSRCHPKFSFMALEVKVKGQVVEHWALPSPTVTNYLVYRTGNHPRCEIELESAGLASVQSKYF